MSFFVSSIIAIEEEVTPLPRLSSFPSIASIAVIKEADDKERTCFLGCQDQGKIEEEKEKEEEETPFFISIIAEEVTTKTEDTRKRSLLFLLCRPSLIVTIKGAEDKKG